MDAQPGRLKPWHFGVGLMLALALLIGLSTLVARSRPSVAVSESRTMLGTVVSLTIVAPTEPDARAAIEGAFSRIAELERELSAQSADSALARVNAAAGGPPVEVPPDLYDAVWQGVRWHHATQGTFDITIMPLLDLWKRCGRENRLPTEEELSSARNLLGANRILLDPQAVTVGLPEKGMRLDLGGLGKGFIAEQVAAYLRERRIRDALIAMSGDIHAMGRRADGGRWSIGVQDPRDPKNPNALLTRISLSDEAVSTAGNYQRFVTVQGKRYSHIVDPRTGRTADAVPSVTVIAPDALTTDILDTALSVLGEEEGMKLIQNIPGVEALFIRFDEQGVPILTRTPGFSRYESME